MAGDSDNSPNSKTNDRFQSPIDEEASEARDTIPDNSNVPKPKRLACMICRKRKLKCDGIRPSCSTCSRLGHPCAYDEQRRKSGPKRGYVKALEERLKQVETLLKTQDAPVSQAPTNDINISMSTTSASGINNLSGSSIPINAGKEHDRDAWNYNRESPRNGTVGDFNNFILNVPLPVNNAEGGFTWEMIGLGLEEPLPPQETIDELHQVYFEKVHPSIPMIHRFRYLAAMNLAPSQRPPVCLRYSMWTMACSLTDKYCDLKDLFYQRARKYIEADYVKGFGEQMISVAHCQAHTLLACYEMKMMYFPRAWINTGSAVRLAQMIGLHRLDGNGLDVKQCLPPAKDWTEREERRRTFWMAFCEDRYASIGTGWPMTIDERDIMTNLPASEEAFEMSRPEQTQTLEECTSHSGAAKLSSFGSIVLMASLFGRNLVHLHRPDDNDDDHDVNGAFWKRHRQMDNILLNTSLCLPSRLKLPAGLANPNVVFTNMSIHTSTICLHQAAIFKAEKNKMVASISSGSKVRCITAANEIASIMRTISHMDLSAMNPFISFCLYVSARVFVQYLKSRPDDDQTVDSLRFLLSAMNALKKRNPLTESFLVQLEVDFDALAQKIPQLRQAYQRPVESPGDQNKANERASDGPLCDNPENVKGILQYRDCEYMDTEERNPKSSRFTNGQVDQRGLVGSSGGYGMQTWLSGDQQMPVLTPSSSGMYDRNGTGTRQFGGFGESSERDAIESPEGQSNGPTPNSSNSGTDLRARANSTRPLGCGAGLNINPALGKDQFHTDNITSSQGMMRNSMISDSDLHNFFPIAVQGYGGMQAAVGHSGSFPVGNSWPEVNNQSTSEPAGEVLRALMTMGPMDAMDLSSWETGNEAMSG